MAAHEGGAGLTLLDAVRWHGSAVPGERSHDLLAALVSAAPRSVADSRLLDDVWAEHEPPSSAKALQVLVSRTRSQTAAGLVVRSGHGYRLGEGDVDVLWLRVHTASAVAVLETDAAIARDEARLALALPVASFSGTDRGPLAELRAEARADQERAREVLGRALSAAGSHGEALPVLEPALASRPGDEALLEAVLRSEAAVRGAPAALQRYERHREQVRDGLGTDPGPALQRLHAELLARDRPVRDGLLHDASRLIGRDDDVAALSAVLRSSRVTSILGPGGLGKTRLAHVMGRLAEQPVVHFVELAGVTSPDGVAVEVGSALGVRDSVASRRLQGAAQRNDLHARILEHLGAAPALLILDNCEHVVEAVADLVAVLVARAPQLRVLTTTRAPLGLAGERVYMLSTLGRDDAVDLFRERATSARPDVRLDDERVSLLVERLDGLPLAVELAAAKVRVMSVDEIERRLVDRFALLRGGSREAPERHQTLLAVIDWSWNLLREDERVAFRRLAAFRDGFSLDGAAAVLESGDILTLVTALVDQSLLTVHESDFVRYRLLETVREFGRMQLVEAGDDEFVDERRRSWAVQLAVEAHARMFTPAQVDSMRELRVEEGNLSDELRRALGEGDVPAVLALMNALSALWTVEGNHLKVINVAASVDALVADATVPRAQLDRLREVLAVLVLNTMVFFGEPLSGSLDRLRALGPGSDDRRIHALVLVLLAANETPGRPGPDATQRLEKLLDDPDPAVVRQSLQWISQLRENAGDLDGAYEAAQSALALSDDSEGPWTAALLTSQLAGIAVQVGDHVAGRTYAERALAAMVHLGAVEDVMQLKAVIAVLEMGAGRLDEAERMLQEIAAEEHRSLFGGTLVLVCGEAELALARDEVELGLRLYREAIVTMGRVALPGLGAQPRLTPWLLYPEAAAVAAHARFAAHEEVRPTRDSLRAKAVTLLGEQDIFLDYPVTGAVIYALALWDLTDRGDPAGLDRAVRLLVLAEVFGYNRTLPSLAWAHAAELAETRSPGRMGSYRAEVAERRAVELRDVAAELVGELDTVSQD